MAEEHKSIIEKIIEAYKQYAPKNITLSQFTEMVEQDPKLLTDIGGAFSTYNPNLARLHRELDTENIESKDSFRNKLKESIDENASEKRAAEIAKMYEKIILSDDDILTAAWAFETLNENQRQDLAIKIICAVNQYFGIADKIKVSYRQDVYKKLIQKFVLKLLGVMEHKKYEFIDYSGLYQKRKITITPVSDFLEFIEIISHEYGHFIDHEYPDFGMLGAQVAAYGHSVYSSIEGDKIYKSNPTEISSLKIEYVVTEHIKKVLDEQKLKKPDLYIKSLNICINYWRAKFAGIDLKYKKILKSADAAEKQMLKTRELVVQRLYPGQDIENVDLAQWVNMVVEANKTKQVKKETEKYHKLVQKAKEYGYIKDKLEYYENLLKEFIQSINSKNLLKTNVNY